MTGSYENLPTLLRIILAYVLMEVHTFLRRCAYTIRRFTRTVHTHQAAAMQPNPPLSPDPRLEDRAGLGHQTHQEADHSLRWRADSYQTHSILVQELPDR